MKRRGELGLIDNQRSMVAAWFWRTFGGFEPLVAHGEHQHSEASGPPAKSAGGVAGDPERPGRDAERRLP